jgi:hypothetical protein
MQNSGRAAIPSRRICTNNSCKVVQCLPLVCAYCVLNHASSPLRGCMQAGHQAMELMPAPYYAFSTITHDCHHIQDTRTITDHQR